MNRRRAFVLAGVNLLVLPGLGTLLAGRRISGLLQIGLTVAGFLLSVRWFSQLITLVTNADGFPDIDAISCRPLAIGSALAIFAWLWSFASSLQFLRATRKTTP